MDYWRREEDEEEMRKRMTDCGCWLHTVDPYSSSKGRSAEAKLRGGGGRT